MGLDLHVLIEKLNPVCRKGLEKAAEFCVAQTHYNVEIEHYLIQLISHQGSDIDRALRHYGVAPGEAEKSLVRALEGFKRGNNRTPALSPQIIQWMEQAWLFASIHLKLAHIRSGALLLALLEDDSLRELVFKSSPILSRVPRTVLRHDMDEIIRSVSEGEDSPPVPVSDGPSKGSHTPALDQFTIDLTERAARGSVDPVQGRDNEIRQIIDILMRRRQNNPILTGEAGVGKTAVVEGLALRIVKDDVPSSLKNISLRLLDMGLLQAGAGIKGEFERRLKSVIDEAKGSPRPVILFIDEAHTLIGAGAPAGMGDAANMLKPALARGELRTIAATTWSEYKKYFEKDPALARRFQVVKVEEPDEAAATIMLRGVADHLEKHHGVRILDEAVKDAVRLSLRYITGRRLPDKAVSVLDTACARVAVAQTTVPAGIENLARRMEALNLEISLLKREERTGIVHGEKISLLSDELARAAESCEALESRFREEKALSGKILALNRRIGSDAAPESALPALRKSLLEAKQQLKEVQGDDPLLPVEVDSRMVSSVISDWTGIPIGKMMTAEIDTVLNLDEAMKERIIGQNHAIETICRRVRTYRANMDDPGKPVGVFLLAGPSGVGKTETAVTLADLLYGGERHMIRLNMSEYQESYTVSGLKGSPPGYVGYGKGGVLTEAVRRNPYSLVLLDEVEKAHPDVMELFYPVFDKGMMEDSEGIPVDFKNTLIILTSNAGDGVIAKACRGGPVLPPPGLLTELVWPELLTHFRPAFLGRVTVVPYYPLEDAVIQEIVRLKLSKIRRRFDAHHRITMTASEDLVDAIAARCRESDTGARNVDHILTHHVLPEVSAEILKRMAHEEVLSAIHISPDAAGEFAFRFDPPAVGRRPGEKSRMPGSIFTPRHLFQKIAETGDRDFSGREIEPMNTKSKKRSRLRDLFNRLG